MCIYALHKYTNIQINTQIHSRRLYIVYFETMSAFVSTETAKVFTQLACKFCSILHKIQLNKLKYNEITITLYKYNIIS